MSVYSERPWLPLYSEGLRPDIVPDYTNGLDLFLAAVASGPDDAAILYFDTTLTFRQLDESSTALAAGLIANGFGPGERLALYVQNNPAFVIGLIAAWKAAGAAVAINPMNKGREVTNLLQDSGATALLALDDLYASVAREVIATGTTDVHTVVTVSALDGQTRDDPRLFAGVARVPDEGTLDLTALIEEYSGAEIALPNFGPDDLAILTYTSGTTGVPKGAMNSHGNLTFNAQTYRDWTGLQPGEPVLGIAPLFHITGLVGHVMFALLTPSPLVLTHRFHADVMLDSIREHNPVLTIGAITALVALVGADGAKPDDFASLRIIYSGGAPIAPALGDRLQKTLGHYIHNVYGLTETSSPTHAVPLGSKAPVDPTSGALSVGVPVFNTFVRVIDEEGNDVPAGEVGEFASSGPQVVAGYWGQPDATAESIPGGELRTGDVGFMNTDGWYFLVDRKKDMINASGYKVWPREVEDVLYGHPSVREAAVIGVPDEYRGESVKAFVSFEPGAAVTEEELISFCKEQMAAYKYPRQIEIIEELPKTVTGKILRRELRDQQRA